MKRLAFVVSSMAVVALIQPVPTHAGEPVPDWAQKTVSLDLSPASVVAEAPTGEPLEVVVTSETDHGPVFDTVVVSSVSAAKKVVNKAQDKSSTIAVEMARPVSIAISNDTYRSRQWALTRLRAETIWGISRGTGVKVAVVDTGVQADHPDLRGRVLRGYDALAPGTSAADGNGHGTHVAGIIAANANNRRGTAGLAPRTSILPVRVLDNNGDGTTATVAKGITWAANHGARIINLSLTGREGDAAMKSAVAYAESKKVLVVAAAGNDAEGRCSSPLNYPAAYGTVIGVGATTSRDAKPYFSACNKSVDLAAPGHAIGSTFAASGYRTMSGTSMAAPFVAATAALAIEELGPRYTLDRLRGELTSTADNLGTAGRDDSFGAGLIDPLQVVRNVGTRLSLNLPSSGIISGGSINVTGRLTRADGSAISGVAVTLLAANGSTTYSWTLMTNPSGDYSARVRLLRNATFKASYAGTNTDSSLTAAIATAHRYKLVRHRWAYRHTASRVYVTNYSRYGQTLKLQKKSGSSWKTVSQVRVGVSSWAPRTGSGTWRLRSEPNTYIALRVSPPWSS